MPGKTYTFRLTSEGVRELDAQLKSFGAAGEQVLENLKTKIPGLGGVLDTQLNRRLDETRQRLTEAAGASNAFTGTLDRSHQSIGALIGRYTTWAVIIGTVTRGIREASQTNDELARSTEELNQEWSRMWGNAAPALTPVVKLTADLLGNLQGIGSVLKSLSDFDKATTFDVPWLPKSSPHGTNLTISDIWPGAGTSNRLDSRGNWIPGAEGFPASGVTDLTEIAAAEKKLDDQRKERLKAEADAIYKVTQARLEMNEKARVAEDKAHDKFMADIGAEIKALANAGVERDRQFEAEEERKLEVALKYGDELLAEDAARRKERSDAFLEDQKRIFESQQEYWASALDAMAFEVRDFFRDLFETGEGELTDFLSVFKRAWSNLLADLVQQRFVGPLMSQALGSMGGGIGALGGLGGGGGLLGLAGGGLLGSLFAPTATMGADGNWIPGAGGFSAGGPLAGIGGLGGLLGAGLSGYGLGSIVGGLTGGSSAGSGIGGALGGILGSFIGMPFLGAALGGGIGGMFGGKPSDMRSVATFGPGGAYSVGAQSAHESDSQTLAAAEQAAAAISQQLQGLMAMGVQFSAQLSNIWIGGRDQSGYQLAGGSRISVGSVGDVGDLAADTIAALIKSATSSDPEIAAILKAGGSAAAITQSLQALTAARAFSSEIEMALLQIQDPLKAALELWKREADARLDLAGTLGVDPANVEALNAALREQIVKQFAQPPANNAPTIAGLDQFINSLQYGPGSAASPQSQYTSAFSDYDAARAAALANPNAQTSAAFMQAAQTFLPIAREYYGTTATYQGFVTGATNTAEQLKGFLSSPTDITTPIVTTIASVGSATIEELQSVKAEVRGTNQRLDSFLASLDSLLRKMPV